jgi:SSS family solute:Na+ symporter
LPASHLQPTGGQGWQALAVWYFIALQTLVEPTFYQRCYAARSEGVARRGILLAIAFWIVFDFLTTAAGLYARAVLPDLTEPVAAYPALAEVTLAPFWQGVFLVGLLATIMSTVDSYAFVCAITLGRDILGRLRREAVADGETGRDEGRTPARGADHAFNATTDRAAGSGVGDAIGATSGQAADADASGCEAPLGWIRWGLVVTAAVAVTLALAAGSVVEIWYKVGSVATPVLLVPLLLAQAGRCRPAARTARVMVVAGGVSLLWLFAGDGGPWLGIEAIFPGLLVSAVLLVSVRRWPDGSRDSVAR